MSIEDVVLDKCRKGMLGPLLPVAPGATVRRAMFIGERLQAMLDSPEGDEAWEERIGKLRADLEYFVTAEEITWKYLFLLSPARDCVWEIRSVRDDPSIRVMGLFAEPDVFIGTNFELRSELGAWDSAAWKKAKRLAIAIWRQLFHPYEPVKFTQIGEIVSGAISGKYFK